MENRPEPTVASVQLGRRMRKYRVDAGVSAKAAAQAIDGSTPKISRYETGRQWPLKRIEVAELLRLYGRSHQEVEDTLALMEKAKLPDWWQDEASVVPRGLGQLFAVETAAEELRTVSGGMLFGMLQTEEYAREIIRVHTTDQSLVEGRVRLRLRRQELLRRESPPRLVALIDEGALRHVIGSRAIMRDQITHLIELGALPNITIRLVTFEAGAHRGLTNGFLWLKLPSETEMPDVVYTESLTGNNYFSKPEQVSGFADAFTSIEALALDPEESVDFLRSLLESHAE
ncbi:helix-turn-helix domain-containing protein [Embleya sp. NPDC059213]|uniref:helix-turn-helix domain-containing protein n=1 Tax=Embleya sp. NPDC059213 TaxID=3346771 RepID=UPI00368907E7